MENIKRNYILPDNHVPLKALCTLEVNSTFSLELSAIPDDTMNVDAGTERDGGQ
jgi:hypothetical protein